MAEITVGGLPQATAVSIDDTMHLLQSNVDKRATIQQIIDAISNKILPAGYILPAAWNNDPASLGIRALPLIGQGVLRTSYSQLDTNVYCGDGSNATATSFYHADDINGTIRNPSGTYLILTDSRGMGIRGFDSTGTVDPDGASRDLGSSQIDKFQGHNPSVKITASAGLADLDTASTFARYCQGPSGENLYYGATSHQLTNNNLMGLGTNGVNGTPRTGMETVMKNLAFNYMITY